MNFSIVNLGAVLRSSARDVSLIAIGILVAFFLDAWWDEQIEQKEISDTLQAVYVDFLSTKDELSTVVYVNKTYMDGVTNLVSLELDDIERLDAEMMSKI